VHSINIEPTDLSFPIRRRRSFSIGVSLATMVWVGPPTDAFLQDEFMELFRRTVELSGDVFFAASALEVQDFVESKAKRRKVGLPDGYKDMPMSEFLHLMVSRTAFERKVVYDSLQEEMGGLGGAFVVDLEQSAHASTPGAIAPSMNTHSEHYSYDSKRLAIDAEYLLMQGVDAHPRFKGSRGDSPLVNSFKGMSYNDYRFLSGNGIHVPVFAAWFLFAMGYIRRRVFPSVEQSLGDAEVAVAAGAAADDEDEEGPRTPPSAQAPKTPDRPETTAASSASTHMTRLLWHPDYAAAEAAEEGDFGDDDDEDEGTQRP
jgi:hypothetical protein